MKTYKDKENNDLALWKSRIYGDNQIYNTGKDEGPLSYAAVSIKNLLWPGAYTVASVQGYVNIYVGYGLKLSTLTVDPFQPGDCKSEPGEEPLEFDEPYPKEGPPKDPVPDGADGDNPDAQPGDGDDAGDDS